MHDEAFISRLRAAVPALIVAGWRWVDRPGERLLMPPEGDPRNDWSTEFVLIGPGERVPAYAIRGGSVA